MTNKEREIQLKRGIVESVAVLDETDGSRVEMLKSLDKIRDILKQSFGEGFEERVENYIFAEHEIFDTDDYDINKDVVFDFVSNDISELREENQNLKIENRKLKQRGDKMIMEMRKFAQEFLTSTEELLEKPPENPINIISSLKLED